MQTVPREKLQDYVGKELPPSDWLTIDQDRINSFADTTLDHQYIHVDPAKAAKTPFGTTIAHGYLTLSLISHFLGQPVKVGSRVRARMKLLEIGEKSPGQLLAKTGVSIEIEGDEKPALVAEILSLFVMPG
jgi:acyl dehydratase